MSKKRVPLGLDELPDVRLRGSVKTTLVNLLVGVGSAYK